MLSARSVVCYKEDCADNAETEAEVAVSSLLPAD